MSSVQSHGDHKQQKSIISNPSLKITLIASVIENKTKFMNTFSNKENEISMVSTQVEISGVLYLILSLREYCPVRITTYCISEKLNSYQKCRLLNMFSCEHSV